MYTYTGCIFFFFDKEIKKNTVYYTYMVDLRHLMASRIDGGRGSRNKFKIYYIG